MGSWNETCGISQLPIKSGDKVRGLFLLRSPLTTENDTLSGGSCYSTDLWFPLGIPFTGVYTDYGKIARPKILPEWEKGNDHATLAYFKESMVDRDPVDTFQGSTEEYERVFSERVPRKKKLTHENLRTWAERGYLRYEDGDENRPVGWWLCLDSVYREMDFIGRNYRHNWHQIKQEANDHGKLENNNLTEALRDYLWIMNICGSPTLSSHYHTAANEITVSGSKELVMQCCKFVNVMTAFSVLRKSWSPQSGKGSQDYCIKGNKMLAQAVIKHCDEMLTDPDNCCT